MSDTEYYEHRPTVITASATHLNVGSLVAKPPTKEKRIRSRCVMPCPERSTWELLSGSTMRRNLCKEWHDTVILAIDFKGYIYHFSADNLFGAQGVKLRIARMHSFEIIEVGDAENPDVVINFVDQYTRSPRSLGTYLGQYVGDMSGASSHREDEDWRLTTARKNGD